MSITIHEEGSMGKNSYKFFESPDDVRGYIDMEFLSTLRDDLERMEGEERKHYAPIDCTQMRCRIADVETYLSRLTRIESLVEQLAGMTTEEEYGDHAPPAEDWSCTLSELIVMARKSLDLPVKKKKPRVTAKKADVAGMVAEMLDGKEWSVEMLDDIAEVLRTAGYQVRDSQEA